MASVAEILKQFKLVGPALTVNRTELVPGSAPAQIRDEGQSILPWDKDEYLTAALPDAVVAQVKAVRAQLPDAGADWQSVKMASKLAFMTGAGNGVAVGPGCDKSKCVMFTDSPRLQEDDKRRDRRRLQIAACELASRGRRREEDGGARIFEPRL